MKQDIKGLECKSVIWTDEAQEFENFIPAKKYQVKNRPGINRPSALKRLWQSLFVLLLVLSTTQAHADQYSKEEWYKDITRDIQPAEPRIQAQRYMFEQPQQVQAPQPTYDYRSYRNESRDDNCTSLRCAR